MFGDFCFHQLPILFAANLYAPVPQAAAVVPVNCTSLLLAAVRARCAAHSNALRAPEVVPGV
jgi:hypothetical protein